MMRDGPPPGNAAGGRGRAPVSAAGRGARSTRVPEKPHSPETTRGAPLPTRRMHMRTTVLHRLGRSLVVATATAVAAAACDDRAPLAPAPSLDRHAADLGGCTNLAPPAGSQLAHHVYAAGVQVYRWDGTAWVFVEPSAVLYADAGEHGAVGTHYAGPTWESNGGSKVVGAVQERCTPDASAIPWLLLRAVSAEGPGIFARTTFIQRVNTVGGKAPAAPGGAAGEVARAPYTAEYLFYRAP